MNHPRVSTLQIVEAVAPRILGAKLCPYCGGDQMYQDSMLIDDSDVFFLVCRACGAEGPSSSLPDVARMLWDVRYDSPVTEQLAQGRLETIRNLTAFVNSIADALGTPVPVTEIEGVGTCFDVVIAIRQLTAENAELKAAEAALL